MARALKKRLIRLPDVFSYGVEAPLISREALPGQLVALRFHEKGERIPLSLADVPTSRSGLIARHFAALRMHLHSPGAMEGVAPFPSAGRPTVAHRKTDRLETP